jgi:MFS family permease
VSAPAQPPAPGAPRRVLLAGAAGWTLVVLTVINLLNYLDRYVVSALVESIKDPVHGLGLSDFELGLLPTAFLVVYMVTSPLFGWLGDRGRRPLHVAVGVFVWSVATALAGAARGFFSIFAARATVGVGEAAYGTITPSILSDLYPRDRRGRVMAVFYAAIPVGAALGYVLGGLVDRAWGWRAAFLIAGLPGVLLAALCLRLPDPPRGAQDPEAPEEAAAPHANAVVVYWRLLFNRPYALTVLGYAAYTFAVGGMAFWMPAFLERARGLPKQEATISFGAVVVVTGFVGTFAGGWLGDRLLRRSRDAYLWLSGVATLAAAPLIWIVFTDPRKPVYMTALVLAELLVFASTGPINTAIVNEVRPQERASAVALSILAIHVLGDVPSPPLIGWISQHSSLDRAVLMVPVAVVVAGIIWTAAAWTGDRARARAAAR